jgi:hypothetical protein
LGYRIRDPSYEASFHSLVPSVDTGGRLCNRRARGQRGDDIPDPIPSTEDAQEPEGGKWSEVLDRLILGLSDQQLATSLAILITAYIRSCEISNYHLNIVCDLAWFSAITHLLSVIVLRVYWTRQTKKFVLYIRLALMICVAVMLGFALFWGPQYDPNPGNGACPAYCEFIMPVDSNIFSEFEFPVQHNPLNFAGVMQSALLIWGYSTTGAFVWPLWRRFWGFLMWRLPGYVFVLPRILTRVGLELGWDRMASYRYIEWVFNCCKCIWKAVFFPSQGIAILIQVLSCFFGIAFLGLDRWGARDSVSQPWVENQWGFGQLLATIIVFLPFLTLLELWSGESSQHQLGDYDVLHADVKKLGPDSKTRRQTRSAERPPCALRSASSGNLPPPIELESVTIARPPHCADEH